MTSEYREMKLGFTKSANETGQVYFKSRKEVGMRITSMWVNNYQNHIAILIGYENGELFILNTQAHLKEKVKKEMQQLGFY